MRSNASRILMPIDLELRQQAIGGSDIAAILGCDPYRDRFSLWAQKRGELPPAEPSLRMQLGKDLEQGIVQHYSRLTGRPTRWVDTTYQHPERPWMVYSPDAVCTNEKRGVDAKLVGWDQRHKWGASADDIPEGVQLQAHWYMDAMDFPLWDIAALVGNDLYIYTLERDVELERAMLAEAEEFYRRYLIGDERPALGATDASGDWLKRRFPRHRADIRAANEQEIGWLNEYSDVRAEQRALEINRRLLENQIKLVIGDHEGLIWPEGRLTWKKTKDRLATNWEALANSLLNGYSDDEKKGLIQAHTETRPGVRRIWFSGEAERDQTQ